MAIHERRTAVNNNSNNIPTYSLTLRTPDKKRRDSNTGYDEEAHNRCLINSTGRAKSLPIMSQIATTSRLAKENSNIHTNFYQAYHSTSRVGWLVNTYQGPSSRYHFIK
ncbi:hypothetical protein JTB14_030536 [Gonioctena quinquepunctata]|nr:hypothetical protein JTB14_030536 [Gonioctena quinquepunctata]